jgi:hypothetical protein
MCCSPIDVHCSPRQAVWLGGEEVGKDRKNTLTLLNQMLFPFLPPSLPLPPRPVPPTLGCCGYQRLWYLQITSIET